MAKRKEKIQEKSSVVIFSSNFSVFYTLLVPVWLNQAFKTAKINFCNQKPQI